MNMSKIQIYWKYEYVENTNLLKIFNLILLIYLIFKY
jgi:hypothetical protein